MKEPVADFFQMFEISPEAIRAQRMQELRDIAEWRKRRLDFYKNWVKPEEIAARKVKHEEEAASALERGEQLSALVKKQIEEKKAAPKEEEIPFFKLTPIYKPAPKTSWLSKVKGLFGG